MQKFNLFKNLSMVLFFIGLLPQSAQALTFTVNTTQDKLDFVQCTPQTPNKCSLRSAIIWSNQLVGTDTIIIPTGVYPITLMGTETPNNPNVNDFNISDSVIIQGAGKGKTIIDGMNQSRIFKIQDILLKDQKVTLTNLDLRRGKTITEKGTTSGAAIYAYAKGSLDQDNDRDILELKKVRIYQNQLSDWGHSGSALHSSAEQVLIEDSEFYENKHQLDSDNGSAGALMIFQDNHFVVAQRNRFHHNQLGPTTEGCMIFFSKTENVWWDSNELSFNQGETQICINNNSGTLLFSNSTISNNDGRVFSNSADLQLLHMTIVDNNLKGLSDSVIWNAGMGQVWINNTALDNEGINCEIEYPEKFISLGNNLSIDDTCELNKGSDLVNTNSLLGPLAFNGGSTQTHMPLAGSPLISGGESLPEVTVDQRGIKRPLGDSAEIGAVEYNVYIPCFPGSCKPHEKK